MQGVLLFAWLSFTMLRMNRAIKQAINKNEELFVPQWVRHLYVVFAVILP